MELYEIGVPFGVATYAMMWLSVLTGTRVIKLGFRWHKRIGIAGLALASLHAGLMVYFGFLG